MSPHELIDYHANRGFIGLLVAGVSPIVFDAGGWMAGTLVLIGGLWALIYHWWAMEDVR